MNKNRQFIKAQLVHHGEKPSSIWSAINKEKKLRDLILRLKIPNTTSQQYERNSIRMAELIRDYHKNLQTIDIAEETSRDRQHKICQTINKIPKDQCISKLERTPLVGTIKQKHILRALKETKDSFKTGMNGCP